MSRHVEENLFLSGTTLLGAVITDFGLQFPFSAQKSIQSCIFFVSEFKAICILILIYNII